jgi:tetratricopeptide (TPR) repeat protein
VADLDRAIAVGEEAVAAAPSDHPNRALYLSNLGAALHARFERVESVADLDRAISVCEEAVAVTPSDHPDRAIYLSNLGYVLQTRFERVGGQHDCERAVELFRVAAQLVSAPADLRAEAARQWGRLAVVVGDWDLAVEGLGLAVELAALVVPRSLGRADQEYRLGELSGLGEEAAAAAVQAGRVETAVELFEHGRGVLFAQVLDARGDLSELEYISARQMDLSASRQLGLDAYMDRHQLDAVLFPGTTGAAIAAKAGYPSVQVPAGFVAGVRDKDTPDYPYGATFTGRAWSEPILLRLAYAFEQATQMRRPPPGLPPLDPTCAP